MNTQKLIVELNQKCEELEQSDCKFRSEAIKHIKAAVAAIKKSQLEDGAFNEETTNQAVKDNPQMVPGRRVLRPEDQRMHKP